MSDMNKRVIQLFSVSIILFGFINFALGIAGDSLIHRLFCDPPAGIISNCYLEDLIWGPLTLLCFLIGGLLLFKYSGLGSKLVN